MRMLMTAEMDTQKANKAIADNTFGQSVQAMLDKIKPEAVYFGAKDGKRTAFVVFDLKDASDIPSVAEPFFQEFDVKIELIPVMDVKDVQAGMQKYAAK